MSAGDVCAVIYAGPTQAGSAHEVLGALSCQSRRPDEVRVAPGLAGMPPAVRSYPVGERESLFAGAVRAGAACGSRWVWLLDGCAVPEASALERLLAAADRLPPPAPVLLASKVVDARGQLHPDATPRHEIFEKAHSVAAAERHLVQLRTAAHGSVLVAGSALARFAPPRTRLPAGSDMQEWSARVLRSWEDTGYLVPASVALRSGGPRARTWRDWLAAVGMLHGGAWRPTETLWEAYRLGGAAVDGARAGWRDGRAGLRGGRAGLRGGRAPAPPASGHRAGPEG